MADEVVLTDAQKQQIKDEWNSRPANPPSLIELTQKVFNNDTLDGRTMQGRAVRKFLDECKLKVPVFVQKPVLSLSDQQKEFIKNNCATMKILEMTKLVFDNASLTMLSDEARCVSEEIAKVVLTQSKTGSLDNPNDVPKESWKPPRKVEEAISRVNRYVHNIALALARLTGKQKKDLTALIGYLNVYRLIHQINLFERNTDRILFESSFIRYCYDKHDLTEEEVDQYIDLCIEVVSSQSLQARVEVLRKLLDDAAQEQDKKISIPLIEALEKIQTEINQCAIRRGRLLDSLKIKRSEKEGREKQGTASLLNLVAMWKEEDERKKIIKVAEDRKTEVSEAIKQLTAMDEIKARILGISVDEVLNG